MVNSHDRRYKLDYKLLSCRMVGSSVGESVQIVIHYGNSAMACKFHEYPKGLIHWKGEQLLDVIYSTQFICAWRFF
jgi:hypothetical protein